MPKGQKIAQAAAKVSKDRAPNNRAVGPLNRAATLLGSKPENRGASQEVKTVLS